MKKPTRTPLILLFIAVLINAFTGNASAQQQSEWKQLFDPELKQWEVFIGVPHTSVDVDWHSKSESGTEGTPMGLNNDPLNVFSMQEIDGEHVLKVSGQIYGGLSTLEEYENYHLSLQFKWGDKKWAPRLNQKRDSGLLVHCVGGHGWFWKAWMRSLECQIQEGDVGDFIPLAGSGADVRVRRLQGEKTPVFDTTQPLFSRIARAKHSPSEEKPHGEWNTIEVYAIGQTTVFVVNGTPNMVLERSVQRGKKGWEDKQSLTKGRIQIQSEAAEVYYRDAKIRSIKQFPDSLKSITQPYDGESVPYEAEPAKKDTSSIDTKSKSKAKTATWEQLETAGSPTARHEAAFVAFKEKIYLIGGRRINPVDVFNPKTGEWTEKSESPIELHHFQAVVHKDLIYLIGAMTGPFPNEKPVERVVAYNPQEDEFEFLHPIPVDRRRGAAGAVVHNDKIYIVGGITNGHIGGFKPWLDEYDPATGKWRILDDAPNARDHFQAVTDGKRIYAAGGRTTSQGTGQLFGLTVKPVNIYDFETEKWLEDSPALPTPRAGNMAIIHEGKLIVGGGETDQDSAHNEVEALDIKTGKWSTMPRLAVGRHGSGFAVVGDYVYTASGCEMRGGSKELTSVERLRLSDADQPKSNKWQPYDGNRIAISADGNSEPDNEHKWPTGDPDDWGATPVTLAMVAAHGSESKLAHFSYNNFIEAPEGPDSKNQMKIGIDGARERWGFADTKFFDVTKQKDEAIDDLEFEITKSTSGNPLYFLHMGPAEFFFQVVEKVVADGKIDALEHVYIVSHSGYNDEHLRRDNHRTIADAIKLSQGKLNYKRIKDQNGDWDPDVLWNSKKDFRPYHWMRDSEREAFQWLFARVQAHAYGKADVSDAGLMFWLLFQDEDGNPEKLRKLLNESLPPSKLAKE